MRDKIFVTQRISVSKIKFYSQMRKGNTEKYNNVIFAVNIIAIVQFRRSCKFNELDF